MNPFLTGSEKTLGRGTTRLALAVTALGAVAAGVGIAIGRGKVAFASLAAAWLFCFGLSAGSGAVAAAIRLAYGRWAKGALAIADAGTAFLGPAIGVLAVILAGSRSWMPIEMTTSQWLFHLGRDLVAAAAVFVLSQRAIRAAEQRAPMGWAVIYLLGYAVGLSVLAVDLVMGLSESAPSTAIPAYYFMGGFLSGLAWVALFGCVDRRIDAEGRHDIGKLLFGFVAFWAYLLWSIFLPTWYANLPDETGQLLARWQGAYRPMTLLVLGLTFAFPFVLLMLESAKRNRVILAVGAGSVLLGLVIERYLLVLPSLSLPKDPTSIALGAAIAVGMLASFTLTFGAALAARPAVIVPSPVTLEGPTP